MLAALLATLGGTSGHIKPSQTTRRGMTSFMLAALWPMRIGPLTYVKLNTLAFCSWALQQPLGTLYMQSGNRDIIVVALSKP